jgi:hypothetical protein
MNGRSQRNALTAAEQAIRSLATGDADRARAAAGRAVDLDQVGAYAGFDSAVETALGQLEATGTVGDAWDMVAVAVPPGPLAIEVEQHRAG